MTSISAESCACAFISTRVSHFIVPDLVTSDRGAQFTSSLWSRVFSTLKISLLLQPVSILRLTGLAGPEWVHHLPLILLGLPTMPKDGSNFL